MCTHYTIAAQLSLAKGNTPLKTRRGSQINSRVQNPSRDTPTAIDAARRQVCPARPSGAQWCQRPRKVKSERREGGMGGGGLGGGMKVVACAAKVKTKWREQRNLCPRMQLSRPMANPVVAWHAQLNASFCVQRRAGMKEIFSFPHPA